MTAVAISTGRVLRFDFPLPENLGNARLHWAQKHRKKERFWELCDNRVLVRMNPRASTVPFGKAEAVIEIRTYRAMDPDNAVARTKWIWDWLKTRGYLIDDSAQHLHVTTSLRTVRKSDVGVSVRLTEVAG